MRNRAAANKAASSPPVPARTSRMALRFVGLVLGQKGDLDLLIQDRQTLLECPQFLFGHGFHFGIARWIGGERCQIGLLPLGRLQGQDALDVGVSSHIRATFGPKSWASWGLGAP